MLTMRWLILSLALIVVIAHSQEKAPSKNDSKTAAQKSAQKSLGTKERPLVITVVPNEADKKEAERGEQETEEKAKSDRDLVKWTAVLAALALLQFLALAVQAYIFRSQARSLRETIDQMRVSEQRQLRAYVGIRKIVLDGFIVEIHIKNFGETPAQDAWVMYERIGREPSGIVELGKSAIGGVVGMLHTDQTLRFQTTIEVNQPGMQFFTVFGHVRYRDMFRGWWRTHFSYLCEFHIESHTLNCRPNNAQNYEEAIDEPF